MRILYLAPHPLWPLTTGARLRDYHCARQLALRAELTFVQMCNEGEQPPEVPGASDFASILTLYKEPSYTLGKIIRGLLGPTPLTVLNYSSVRAGVELQRILEERGPFDTVQLEGVHMSGYIPTLNRSRAALVADWHNIESELMARYARSTANPARKLAAWRTARLLEHSESVLVGGCDSQSVVSEREQQILRQRYPRARIDVIPNGVDTAHYAGRGEGERKSLLFVGSMDYHANIDAVAWFVAEVWPALASRNSGLRLTVVGKDPPASIRALANERIEVTGTVPDVRPYYEDALAVVVPLRVGSGTRLKILEAMAARVPVVSTRCGAEGINAVPGGQLLLAETAEEFCTAVHTLSREPATVAGLVASAHQLVSREYDWNVVGARLFEVHRRAVECARKRLEERS